MIFKCFYNVLNTSDRVLSIIFCSLVLNNSAISFCSLEPAQNNLHYSKLRQIKVPTWFVLEAIIQALICKSSWSSILKTPNHLHPIHHFQPDSSLPEYLNICACLMKLGKREARIVKADYGCVNSNTQIPDRYSTCIQPWINSDYWGFF